MSFLERITPILITWNEEDNLPRVLARLEWARDILVVDSGSTDGTLPLLASTPRVRVLNRPFSTFSDQWNFALAHIKDDWVMTLDADYVLSEGLVEELRSLEPADELAGYAVRFVYYNLGRPLRGSLYPPRTVLFRRRLGRFHEEGHQQRLALSGRSEMLAGPIHHEDRKALARWLASQERYATVEARRLLEAPARDLDWMDRIRRTGTVAPLVALGYSLLAKGGALDGGAGLHYALQRGVAEAILAMKIWERRKLAAPGPSATRQ